KQHRVRRSSQSQDRPILQLANRTRDTADLKATEAIAMVGTEAQAKCCKASNQLGCRRTPYGGGGSRHDPTLQVVWACAGASRAGPARQRGYDRGLDCRATRATRARPPIDHRAAGYNHLWWID